MTVAGRPLDGVRVVCLAALGPVPLATMLLGDLGADVIRVDRANDGEELTGLRPEDDPRTRGHRAIGIDLKRPEGRALALALTDRADVFLEGMRPGAAERLGLGPTELRARNRGLIYGRMTGWGQHGPLATQAGHDINYLAMSGALHAMGPREQPPTVPLNLVADFGGGGVFLALGVVSALVQRVQSGQGQVIDCAMIDGVASLTAMFHGMLAAGAWRDERSANIFDGAAPFYRTYGTSDGRFIAVGALEPQFYQALLRGLGLQPGDWPQHDRARWPAQAAALAERFATRTRDEWVAVFAGTDACVTPVLTFQEAAGHPDLAARATFVDGHGLVQPAAAPRFSGAAAWGPEARAARCSHTDDVAAEAGYTPAAIAALRRTGVIA